MSIEDCRLSGGRSIATPQVPANVIGALAGMRAPLLIAHVVPDADALGAMFATARACASGTCQPTVALPDGSLSQRLTFLYDMAEVTVATPDDFSAADGFVAFDTAKKGRCNVGPALKDTDWSGGRPMINIDHHTSNSNFGTANWIDPRAGSTAELVYRLIRAARRPIDPLAASLLYAGIHSDTVGF